MWKNLKGLLHGNYYTDLCHHGKYLGKFGDHMCQLIPRNNMCTFKPTKYVASYVCCFVVAVGQLKFNLGHLSKAI